MIKLLLFTTILFCWAIAAFADNLSYLPDHSGYTTLLMSESYDQPEKEVEIFPNPVTEGRLTLTTSENIKTVQILNITGKMVFSQDYPPGTLSATIELDKPEKGIYLVRIGFADKTTHTEKIMIK
ncbi:MAG: T9SS type A sorting domain-containing protein [Bacteroidales bacterium]|nr:T9SS type A sorting domain-containing protein [Bacteroidales bacterium]